MLRSVSQNRQANTCSFVTGIICSVFLHNYVFSSTLTSRPKVLGHLMPQPRQWSFCLPSPPHPQHNVDVDPSKVDPTALLRGRGGLRKLTNDLPLLNNTSTVCICQVRLLVSTICCFLLMAQAFTVTVKTDVCLMGTLQC